MNTRAISRGGTGIFGNSEGGSRPPLEAITRKLVKTVAEDISVPVAVICRM